MTSIVAVQLRAKNRHVDVIALSKWRFSSVAIFLLCLHHVNNVSENCGQIVIPKRIRKSSDFEVKWRSVDDRTTMGKVLLKRKRQDFEDKGPKNIHPRRPLHYQRLHWSIRFFAPAKASSYKCRRFFFALINHTIQRFIWFFDLSK